MTSIRQPRRSLPTLTEIVQPVAATDNAPVVSEALIAAVLEHITPLLQRQLGALLQHHVTEGVRQLMPPLQQNIETLVRDSVTQAMHQMNQPEHTGSKPLP